MTVEQHGEIEYSELVERTAREKSNAAKKKLEESLRSDEEIETRALEKARTWDEFKDDNPFGSGNSKLRPCG
jgi:immunoglobulin-binding protein 1